MTHSGVMTVLTERTLLLTLLCALMALGFSACTSSVRFASRGTPPAKTHGVKRPVPVRNDTLKTAMAAPDAETGTGTPVEELPLPSEPIEPPGDGTMAETPFAEGEASYYAHQFHGRTTANGETFDMHEMTAAHRTLPFNTRLRVYYPVTGKSVLVRINDRGPYKKGRILDLSLAAAKSIGLTKAGTGTVQLYLLEPKE